MEYAVGFFNLKKKKKKDSQKPRLFRTRRTVTVAYCAEQKTMECCDLPRSCYLGGTAGSQPSDL